MSRAEEYLNENKEDEDVQKRVRTLTQFGVQGNKRRPTTKTIEKLKPGIYEINADCMGLFFEVHEVSTDELFRFEDSRYNQILEEVKSFWELKSKFQKLGFTNKRGVLLHGDPGTGKSCLLKLMMEDMVEQKDVVFITKNPNLLVAALKQFREVEEDRKALVILEDMDTIIRYGEHAILELFDGDDQMGDVIYVGTTNYIDRLPPRILREGRFDRKVEILSPPKAGRLAYLSHKLKRMEEGEDIIEKHANDTDGFTFGQLREFLVGVYCFDKSPAAVIERIKRGGGLDESIESTGIKDMTDKEFNEYFFENAEKGLPKGSVSLAENYLSNR